jgi:uncharacterized iron-regulated membrane protein
MSRSVSLVPPRRFWFALHGWLALPIWVFLLFVCLTGTLSVVSHEVTWLVDSRVRASNPAGDEPLGFGAIAEAVRREHPEAAVLYMNRRAPYLANSVIVGLPGVPFATAYVNQYTGEVQGIIQGITFPEFMRSLHGWLLLPWTSGTSIGYYLVGSLSILMLGLLLSGVVVHRRVVRTLYRPVLRRDRGERVWWGDVHRLLGAWSVWFILTIGLTGSWFLAQGIMWDTEVFFEPMPPVLARGDAPTVLAGSPRPTVDLDAAVEAARAAVPDLDVKWIYMPDNAFSPVTVLGKQGFPIISDYAAGAYVEPFGNRVLEAREVSDLGAVGMMDNLADPLHYGSWGGLWSKAIWFVFGMMLSTLVLSGFIVWTKRTVRATLPEPAPPAKRATPLAPAGVE